MSEKGIVYYVVYEAWKDGKSMGKGNCEVGPIKPVATMDDVKSIEEAIKGDKDSFGQLDINILVLNYIPLQEAEYEEGQVITQEAFEKVLLERDDFKIAYEIVSKELNEAREEIEKRKEVRESDIVRVKETIENYIKERDEARRACEDYRELSKARLEEMHYLQSKLVDLEHKIYTKETRPEAYEALRKERDELQKRIGEKNQTISELTNIRAELERKIYKAKELLKDE